MTLPGHAAGPRSAKWTVVSVFTDDDIISDREMLQYGLPYPGRLAPLLAVNQ
jgi:hypothetical protein